MVCGHLGIWLTKLPSLGSTKLSVRLFLDRSQPCEPEPIAGIILAGSTAYHTLQAFKVARTAEKLHSAGQNIATHRFRCTRALQVNSF